MRFSFCQKLTRLKGFFWPQRLFPYGASFSGHVRVCGVGQQGAQATLLLADGCFSAAPAAIYRPALYKRQQNLGLGLLEVLPPHIEATWPWAWAALRQLRVRSYKSSRYKLGLPANGQRTRANAATVKRVADAASYAIRRNGWVRKVWEPRKQPAKANRAKGKSR